MRLWEIAHEVEAVLAAAIDPETGEIDEEQLELLESVAVIASVVAFGLAVAEVLRW